MPANGFQSLLIFKIKGCQLEIDDDDDDKTSFEIFHQTWTVLYPLKKSKAPVIMSAYDELPLFLQANFKNKEIKLRK